MSTQLRHLAQAPAHSPVRTKYFLAVVDLSGTGVAGDSLAVPASPQTLPAEALIFDADFGNVFGAPRGSIASGTLLRDLGRSVIVTDAACNHLYRYRQVQLVSGSGSEGVGGVSPTWNSDFYVLVWAANGANVNVVRTG